MKKFLLSSHILLIFIGIFFNFTVNAEMYKWVDDEGNTHYSQSPPIDNASVEVIKPPSKVDTDSAAKNLEKRQKAADELREERITSKEEKLKAEEEALAKQQKCDQAKKRLASYQRPRVSVENADGSLRVLSEEERQSEISKSNKNIKDFCE